MTLKFSTYLFDAEIQRRGSKNTWEYNVTYLGMRNVRIVRGYIELTKSPFYLLHIQAEWGSI